MSRRWGIRKSKAVEEAIKELLSIRPMTANELTYHVIEKTGGKYHINTPKLAGFLRSLDFVEPIVINGKRYYRLVR